MFRETVLRAVKPWRGLCLLAPLAGCSDLVLISPEISDTASDSDLPEARSFFLQVLPTPGTAGDEVLLEQTFGSFVEGDGFQLVLEPARRVRGVVEAVQVTPWLANLPTERGPVSGEVVMRSSDGRDVRSTTIGADGRYELLAVPGSWRFSVVPDDPRVGARTDVLLLSEDLQHDPILDPGVPIWGRVTDASGFPIGGAVVRALQVDPEGTPREGSGDATTDGEGWYELRVEPGPWVVQTTGRPGGRDPSLQVPAVTVETGSRVDLSYPTDARASLTARIVDPDGRALPRVRMRMSSRALYGFDGLDASFQVEVTSDSRGYVDTRIPAGDYLAEVLPEDDDPWAAVSIPDVRVSGDVDLGTQRLVALIDQGGIVLDSLNQPVVGATIRLRERTSDGRAWVTTTDESGLYVVPALAEAGDLDVIPTGGVGRLSAVRLNVEPGGLPPTLQLPDGELIGGTVTWQSSRGPTSLPYAEVRVLDVDGVTRGYGVTDDDGGFQVFVAWDWSGAAVDDTGL